MCSGDFWSQGASRICLSPQEASSRIPGVHRMPHETPASCMGSRRGSSKSPETTRSHTYDSADQGPGSSSDRLAAYLPGHLLHAAFTGLCSLGSASPLAWTPAPLSASSLRRPRRLHGDVLGSAVQGAPGRLRREPEDRPDDRSRLHGLVGGFRVREEV